MADPGGGTLSNLKNAFGSLRLNVNPLEAEATAFFDNLLKAGSLNDESVLFYYNNILRSIDDSKSHALYNITPDNKSKSMDMLIKHLTYYKVLVQKIIKPFVRYPPLKLSVASVNDSISTFTPIQLIAYFYSDNYKGILAYSPYRAEEATKKMNAALLSKKLPFLPIPEEMLKDNFKAYIKIYFMDKPPNDSMATPGLYNHASYQTYYKALSKEYYKVWTKFDLNHINETFLTELWFLGLYLTQKLGKGFEKPDINEAFMTRVLMKPEVKPRIIADLEKKHKDIPTSPYILFLLQMFKGEMTRDEAISKLLSMSGGRRKRTRKTRRKIKRISR
jgi:hypothetical protein